MDSEYEGFESTCFELAQDGFDFAPHPLNGIEVWAVWRQKGDARASLGNKVESFFVFVGLEVIENNDVAGAQRRSQEITHVGAKIIGVGSSREGRVSGGTVAAHRGDHCGGSPVTVRRGIVAAFTASRTSVKSCHVGFRASLIDKHQAAAVPVTPFGFPPLTTGFHIQPRLLISTQRFF